ncbi:hypothetical protein [Sulfoacidibacillus ferrooxidans]|uniref:Uncharacterized protein n=1 Tax=Sulfoacidibacillus ferrooxidans TaxID=2005001 RepID=A0A9X1V6X1_9BACL|nr:hypothetical protein [Sulfoacidibacillus ferrooxidans]MCI0182373.1 hypothetical protein [Sulfoacidibacillus ferrooxidans]
MEQDNVREVNKFRMAVGTILALLVIQFILGMVVNLYVQIPSSLPNGNAMSWTMSHSPLILMHMIVGTLILVVSIWIMMLSLSFEQKSIMILSIVGFVFIISTWAIGIAFLTSGQTNILSLMMSLGFILSTVTYGIEMYGIRNGIK